MVARLSAAREEFEARQRSSVTSRETTKDPELDQFMVTLLYSLPCNLHIFVFAKKEAVSIG